MPSGRLPAGALRERVSGRLHGLPHDHGLGRSYDGPHDPQQWVRASGQPRHPALYELSHPGRRGNALRSHDPGRLCGVSPDRLPGTTQRLGLSRNVSDLSPGHHLDRGHRGSRRRVGWVRTSGGPRDAGLHELPHTGWHRDPVQSDVTRRLCGVPSGRLPAGALRERVSERLHGLPHHPGWDGATTDHTALSNGFGLLGNHGILPCTSCHIPGGGGTLFDPTTPEDCVACHQTDYQAGTQRLGLSRNAV